MSDLQRIADLTEDELLALTDEDVQRYIDIEAAYAGIIPAVYPGERPEAPTLEFPIIAYKVGDLVFLDRDEALAVAGMSSLRAEDYDWSLGHKNQWLTRKLDSVNAVKAERYTTKEAVEELRPQLREHKKEVEAYGKLASEFEKYNGAMDDVRFAVTKPVSDARDRKVEVDRARQVYSQHLVLANGDRAIAANFFRKAYESLPELIDAVLFGAESESTPEAEPAQA